MRSLHALRPLVFLALGAPFAAGAVGCGGGSSDTGSGGTGGSGASNSTSHGGNGDTGGSTSSSTSDGGAGTGGGSGGGHLKGTPIKDFTGVNALIVDPVDSLTPLGWVREYHNWGWICDNYAEGPAYPGMKYTFMNFNGWDWDVFFAGLKAGGVQGFPAVQGGVPWLQDGALPPIPSGADKTLAASYIAHGDTMFQIAARYGSTHVPDAKLKLKDGQTRSSGLDTVQYFEDFNEQDNAANFTADAFAAMASADYDGDQNRLGDAIGVKNADPHAKLVMGGLSGRYPTTAWVQSITDFLDGMRTWAQANRAGSFPADVINVHLYSFSTSDGAPAPSPEADGIYDKLKAIVDYRDHNLPGKEIWWTEFGYDTYESSILRAPAIGPNSAFIVQGQWLIRDFLAALKAGIDRATLFELDDTCKIGDSGCHPEQQFTTCGLIDGNGTKKASWYFVAAFRAALSNMVFTADVTDAAHPDQRVYAFKDTTKGGGALVVWNATSTAHVEPGFSLDLPAGTKHAKAVTLVDQMANGATADLTVHGGKTTLDVSETPTIVLVDAM